MRVLIVDDHAILREGLRALLNSEGGFEIVGSASNGREAAELARTTKPHVVLMDIQMPELNGVDATRRIMAENPQVKVIGLSMHRERRFVVSMFAAGAVGYLPKNAPAAELVDAIRSVAGGLTYVSPSIAAFVVDECVAPGASLRAASPLTQREREVLQLLAEGRSSKQIAGRLNLAVATVETHRRQIMDRLALRSVAELTKYAVREGLTSLE